MGWFWSSWTWLYWIRKNLDLGLAEYQGPLLDWIDTIKLSRVSEGSSFLLNLMLLSWRRITTSFHQVDFLIAARQSPKTTIFFVSLSLYGRSFTVAAMTPWFGLSTEATSDRAKMMINYSNKILHFLCLVYAEQREKCCNWVRIYTCPVD